MPDKKKEQKAQDLPVSGEFFYQRTSDGTSEGQLAINCEAWEKGNGNGQQRPLELDFTKQIKTIWKEQGYSRNPLYKALGKPVADSYLLDATFGLGRDSLFFIRYGWRVVGCERLPFLWPLLANALAQAQAGEYGELFQQKLSLSSGDARDYALENGRPAVIYLDPMYEGPPSERKQGAKKEMNILHLLCREQQNSPLPSLVTTHAFSESELLPWALATATKRVVVKRSKKGPWLSPSPLPNLTYSGASTRFDVYFIS
jgi:hypothetical protein